MSSISKTSEIAYSSLLLIAILAILSCAENVKKSNAEATLSTTYEIPVSKHTQEVPAIDQVVQHIIDLPRLQGIFHQEVPARVPAKIQISEKIPATLNVKKYDQKVKMMTTAEVQEANIDDVIVFNVFEFKADTLNFDLFFKTENVNCYGKFHYNKKNWTLVDYEVTEFKM